MKKFSLNSLPKKIRFFLFVVVVLSLLTAGVNIFFTVFFRQQIKKIQMVLRDSGGSYVTVRAAYFNIFSGFLMRGVTCGQGSDTFFTASHVDFGLDVLSLLQKKIRIKNIDVRRPRFFLKNISQFFSLGQKMFSQADKQVGFFETIYFKGKDFNLDDMIMLDLNGYLSFIKGSLFISRGQVVLKKIQVPAVPAVDLFRASSFYKPFDYIFEAENKGEDFIVSRLELSNPVLKFSGSGTLKNIATKPLADFDLSFLNVLLEGFPALNHKHIQSQGVVDSTLQISGPLDNLNVLCNVRITNAQLILFNSLFFTKVNGSAVLTRDHVVGQGFSLSVNSIPFLADFAYSSSASPQFLLELSSRHIIPKTQDFVATLSANWIDNEFVGDLKSTLKYAIQETANTVDCHLTDLRFGYEDDLFINAEKVLTKVTSEQLSPVAGNKNFSTNLNLEHFFGVLQRQENGFALNHLKATCYDGTLEGAVELIPQGDHIDARGEAHARGVDLAQFFKESPMEQGVLEGGLDGDLKFDTALSDIFKGQFFVTDGFIENNPILNVVSNFFSVPSLKKVSFKELSVFFTGGRGEYNSQMKLESPQANGLLDGKISSYEKMDGYLTVQLSTQLLNESKVFKRLLAYIRHDEPSVVFPFKIFSYIRSPRVLWLKNEFKEKIQNLLPERNKRYLQRQVNGMVEKIEGE